MQHVATAQLEGQGHTRAVGDLAHVDVEPVATIGEGRQLDASQHADIAEALEALRENLPADDHVPPHGEHLEEQQPRSHEGQRVADLVGQIPAHQYDNPQQNDRHHLSEDQLNADEGEG